MRIVLVENLWSITVDQFNNHTPERWVQREGGKPIPNSDKLSKPFAGWVSTQKFFPNIGQAAKWIVQQDMLDKDTILLVDYVQEFEDRVEELLNSFLYT